jgi:uncharacterized iron-regulated membrane protein
MHKLSYFNLLLAIVYLLIYLRSGTFNSTAGTLMIIIFNWLYLRSFENDKYKWTVFHYLTGLWSIYFIGTVVYSTVHVLLAAIAFDFITNDTIFNIVISFMLSIGVVFHFVVYGFKNFKLTKS